MLTIYVNDRASICQDRKNSKKRYEEAGAVQVDGEWNGKMTGKWSGGRTETFLDVNSLPVTKKNVKRVAEQEKYESRLEKNKREKIKLVSPLYHILK